MKVCNVPGCGTLTRKSKCLKHEREADRARGTRHQRGYGKEHDALRRQWAPIVESGRVVCWRCRELITPGAQWDLGHLDDRTGYGGPEHANRCNRAAAGRSAHR